MVMQISLKKNKMQELPLVKDINLYLDEKPSVYALRQKARQALEKNKYPTKKTEAWKYTNIQPILSRNLKFETEEHVCTNECCHNHEKSSKIEIRFCNGKLHIEEYNLPKGLIIKSLPEVLYEGEYKQYLFNSFDIDKHPFAALNGIYLEQGICIYVEKNTKITDPIEIIYSQNKSNENQIHIHNLIILEKGASIEIYEKSSSDKVNTYLINTINEIYLKPDSCLHHYKKQNDSNNSYHIALNSIKIQSNASYKQYYLSKGAQISRQETAIDLQQSKSSAEIYTAYTAQKNCLTDITTNINHLSENTYSNQYAKAILEDQSSAVFQGKIHIAPDAIKTEGHQLHKALYLNENADLNCKPELEIFADDVKCSHGASCGEIDKEQLFYLISRGISKKDAINLLISAHLQEIISLIPNKDIQEEFSY